jgi:uncharacterized protein (DUF1501 family)
MGAASVGTLALRPFGLLPALAQSGPDYRALVCVFLFGGNDSNNTIIPMDDTNYKAYMSIRQNLALTGSSLTSTVYSLAGAPYAFHAKLPDLANLFSTRELAVVANVGSLIQPMTRSTYQSQAAALPSNLFSHLDQQLQWQSSVAQGTSTSGWAGRAADYVASQKMNSTGFPSNMSVAGNVLFGVGTSTELVTLTPGQTLQLAGFSTSAVSQSRWNALNNLLSLPSGLSLAQAANGTLAHSITDAASLTAALAQVPALKTVFPNTSLGGQLKQVAQVIQVQAQLGMRRQIFFASLGGFDTHTNEINTHVSLYPQVNDALVAFYKATQELQMADNVTTFTESEFNRTFQPTSGAGADHGWGSHHMVLGGAVQGGQIYGQFPTFQLGGPSDTDTRGRWIPTTSIDQYGATLASWFGIPDAELSSMFPNLANFGSQKLAFV